MLNLWINKEEIAKEDDIGFTVERVNLTASIQDLKDLRAFFDHCIDYLEKHPNTGDGNHWHAHYIDFSPKPRSNNHDGDIVVMLQQPKDKANV